MLNAHPFLHQHLSQINRKTEFLHQVKIFHYPLQVLSEMLEVS